MLRLKLCRTEESFMNVTFNRSCRRQRWDMTQAFRKFAYMRFELQLFVVASCLSWKILIILSMTSLQNKPANKLVVNFTNQKILLFSPTLTMCIVACPIAPHASGILKVFPNESIILTWTYQPHSIAFYTTLLSLLRTRRWKDYHKSNNHSINSFSVRKFSFNSDVKRWN